MALEVVWTAYGPAAWSALHDAVATAKAGEPLAPVTVVVPSNHVGVASRRLLSSGALGPVAGSGVGLAAVTFATTYRIAELLGAPALAAAGRRPVSTPVLAAAVRAELAVEAGLFAPVREHPATESALVATYRELRDLSAASLEALERTSARAGEVVRLHRAVRRRLESRWYDEEDLLLAAASAAGRRAAELGSVVVHLPQRLSQHSGALLADLADHVPVIVVAGLCGAEAADHEVRLSLRRLGFDAQPPDGAGDPAPVSVERTRIVTTSDADEEVRAAVRAVTDAVRDGVRLDRIAVLHASPEPYARIAHEQLRAAGIATNGAAVLPLSSRIAGRTLLDLLALPDGGFRRQDVFAWLTSAPVLVEGRWAPVADWERISRDAAVVAGRDDWDHHLSQFAQGQEERAARLVAEDAPEPNVLRARRRAERARALRALALELIDDLDGRLRSALPWSAHARWAQGRLDALLGSARERTSWPQPEVKAAERVEQAIARLGALDAVEGPVGLEVFRRTLQVELEADLGRVGRFGDGVLVGSVEMGIGLQLDLVVVLGLAEGSFPATVRDDSLLPDHERAACDGELAARRDRIARQHRQLLAALAGAHRQVLCVPRGDLRRSAERVPSRWVLDLAAAVEGSGRQLWAGDLPTVGDWAQVVPSFDAGLRAMPVPATDQEHRLRELMALAGRVEDLDDPLTRGSAAAARDRRSDRFTRFDGNLTGVEVRSPFEGTMSPTRLERWASCPHQFLVEDLLGALPVDNPEEELSITPIDKGNLVHRALERFFGEVVARPPEARPTPRDPWTEADRQRMQAIGEEECLRYERLGLTGRPIFWRREKRRLLSDLQHVLRLDESHRLATGTTPVAVELAFGVPRRDGEEVLPPVVIDLPEGRSIAVRGRADRLDVAGDGTIHVVDYKTGSSSKFKKLSEEEPVQRGSRLQLPVYGLAGRLHQGAPDAPVRAEYWFLNRKAKFERIGYQVSDDVLTIAADALSRIMSGIEAGLFPPHPEDNTSTRPSRFVSCGTCDPDRLGTVELRQSWERKRGDALLAVYADFVEPLEAELEALEPQP